MDINTKFNAGLVDLNKENAATNKLNKTLKTDMSESTDEELMSVCKDFEAYFLEQVFKNMKKTIVPAEEKTSNTMADYFEDNLYQEYSKNASDTGNYGIAQMLYEQMKRNYNL